MPTLSFWKKKSKTAAYSLQNYDETSTVQEILEVFKNNTQINTNPTQHRFIESIILTLTHLPIIDKLMPDRLVKENLIGFLKKTEEHLKNDTFSLSELTDLCSTDIDKFIERCSMIAIIRPVQRDKLLEVLSNLTETLNKNFQSYPSTSR